MALERFADVVERFTHGYGNGHALEPRAVQVHEVEIEVLRGGLREIGEPARKAMIVDLADPSRRGRTVGLYYLTRSLSITPAAAIGGLLWKIAPQVPFVTAGVIGIIGTIVFAATVEERFAS